MAKQSETKWMQDRIESAIQKVVEESAEYEVFPETLSGDDTVIMMSRAAMAVYLAVAESQVYLRDNGYTKKL